MLKSQPPPAQSPAEPQIDLSEKMKPQYTYAEVAALKRVSVQTVQEWVRRGKIPPPVYTGFTARFTTDAVAEIMTGIKPEGTYEPPPSPRREIGKLGGSSSLPAPGKSRNPSQARKDKQRAAVKPKPAKKKPAKGRDRKHAKTKKGGK